LSQRQSSQPIWCKIKKTKFIKSSKTKRNP